MIFFGNESTSVHPDYYLNLSDSLLAHDKYFSFLFDKLSITDLVFLKQTHSTTGYAVEHAMPSFAQEGDYLITNKPHIGIGIMTADCLPVIVVDKQNNAVGIAHAGWRGAVAGIVPKMITHMGDVFGSSPAHMRAYLGPSAQACCYEVGPEVIECVGHPYINQRFFDLPGYVLDQLEDIGISSITPSSVCTICDTSYCSHRRATHEGRAKQCKRQMSIVSVF